jgi:hypothetical protein
MESHPEGNHFVCLNLPEGFEIKKDMDPQKAIDSVNAIGGSVIYAHPYWLGHTIDAGKVSQDRSQGGKAFEVCYISDGRGAGFKKVVSGNP